MRYRAGHVIDLVVAEHFGASFAAPYSASKGGTVQLSKGLASAWAKDNIQVNSVLPGWSDTDLTRRARLEVSGLRGLLTSNALQSTLGAAGRARDLQRWSRPWGERAGGARKPRAARAASGRAYAPEHCWLRSHGNAVDRHCFTRRWATEPGGPERHEPSVTDTSSKQSVFWASPRGAERMKASPALVSAWSGSKSTTKS